MFFYVFIFKNIFICINLLQHPYICVEDMS